MVWTCPMLANNDVNKESFAMQVDGPPRGRGGMKRTWMEVVKIDLKKCNLSKDLIWPRIDQNGEPQFM